MIALVAILGWPSVSRALDGVEQWFDYREEEELVVFPTYATVDEEGGLTVPLHAWTFEPEEDSVARDAFVSMLREALELESEETGDTFERRIRPFLVDNERGKTVQLQVADQTFDVGITRPDGHVEQRIDIPRDVAARAVRVEEGRRWLEPTVDAGFTEKNVRIPIVEKTGWSVVSDIDDTVKVTEVRDLDEMLERTFLREFEAVDGMAPLYGRLADDLDAHFHYLSASPWQLLAHLESFLREVEFPPGTFHLRKLRPKSIRSPIDFVSGSESFKKSTIRRLLEDFPNRKFVLIGDSGEHDPEIYGAAARSHGDQIRAIWIREVAGAENADERFEKAFDGVDPSLWQTFETPGAIDVDTLGEETESSARPTGDE